jgi:hypothetical protein
VAHHQKDQKGENKEPRKPEKMPCILENTHQTLSTKPLPGASATLVENIPRASDGTSVYLTAVCEEDHTLTGRGLSP